MKSLWNGVNPNEAPVSQIRMRVRGSLVAPPTEQFSNVPQSAATHAMQEEMFFSWSIDLNCDRSLGSWRNCTSDLKNLSKVELESLPNSSTPLLRLELHWLIKKVRAHKCPFIQRRCLNMFGDRNKLPSNHWGQQRERLLHRTTKAKGKAWRHQQWARLWLAWQ
jgi:hypothetical protein